MDIVNKLRQGSANLNRMQDEIRETIILFLGFVRFHYGLQNLENHRVIKGSASSWRFNAVFVANDPSCNYLNVSITDSMGQVTVFWAKAHNISPPPQNCALPVRVVKEVRADLPLFVDEMMRAYPEMQYLWKPLIDASEV